MSDADEGIASPLSVVQARGKDLETQVREVIAAGEEYGVEAYVLGIPINMDGSEGDQVKLTRRFGTRLAEATGRPVHEWDERLSSLQADEYLAHTELTSARRKARRDALAAQVILQSFLDRRPADGDATRPESGGGL